MFFAIKSRTWSSYRVQFYAMLNSNKNICFFISLVTIVVKKNYYIKVTSFLKYHQGTVPCCCLQNSDFCLNRFYFNPQHGIVSGSISSEFAKKMYEYTYIFKNKYFKEQIIECEHSLNKHGKIGADLFWSCWTTMSNCRQLI